MDIPRNTTVDTVLEDAVKYAVEQLATNNQVRITRINNKINRAQAEKIADMFKDKGYYHEIRMTSTDNGKVKIYCLTISKTPIHSHSSPTMWSEYVG